MLSLRLYKDGHPTFKNYQNLEYYAASIEKEELEDLKSKLQSTHESWMKDVWDVRKNFNFLNFFTITQIFEV